MTIEREKCQNIFSFKTKASEKIHFVSNIYDRKFDATVKYSLTKCN